MLSSISVYLGPLFSVAVGWLLHELSDTIRVRREDRRAVGNVLAELLELHSQLCYLPKYLSEIKRRFALPSEADAFLRTVVDQLLSPMRLKMEERYNEAIDSIKGRLPILAFQLRGKDLVKRTFDHMRSLASPDPAAVAAFPLIEDALSQEAAPLLERLLLRLAWIHGFGTWLRVRRRLSKKVAPIELYDLLDSLLKAAGVNLPSGTPPTP